MTLARTERDALCDTALLVGEAEPTLCGDWTVKDLVVHLILRESSPAALGVVVPALAGRLEAASQRMARRDFAVLVERLRGGAPVYSPFAIPQLDALLNGLEFFVHHEDIRRAQQSWSPRELSAADEGRLWKQIRSGGRRLVRGVPVGVDVERSDTGERATLKAATPSVLLRGTPAEVTMFVFGRKDNADVELRGPDEAVATLRDADLGV